MTVNAGSNDLTLISGFDGSNPTTSTIASGGVDPDAAFAFDAGSGFEDLVVGNAGDGVLALFEGGPDGLGLTSAASEPNLPDPTALAFSALTGGQVQFYAATAGRESAELVALSLGIETGRSPRPLRTFVRKCGGPTGVAARVVAAAGGDGADAHDHGVSEELNLVAVETETTAVAAFLPGTGISVGQGLSSQRSGGPGEDDGPESDESKAGVAGAVPAVIAPWERYRDRSGRSAGEVPAGEPQRGFGCAGSGLGERSSRLATRGGLPAQGGPTSLKSGPEPGSERRRARSDGEREPEPRGRGHRRDHRVRLGRGQGR